MELTPVTGLRSPAKREVYSSVRSPTVRSEKGPLAQKGREIALRSYLVVLFDLQTHLPDSTFL